MNKAPKLLAGKIGKISQTGEDRDGKGTPPALPTQLRMEKSQQAPWILFHRDPNLCPTGLAPAESRAPLHFIPLKQAHPSCTSTGARLYGAGDTLAFPSPASGSCCHHSRALKPLLHASLLRLERSQETHSKMQRERITSLSGFVPLDSQTFLLLQKENTFSP